MKCVVEGCNKEKYHSKLYCSMHYRRLKFTGTLEDGPRARLSLEERFFKKVKKQDNGCWLWVGGKSSNGYGVIGAGGKGGKHLSAHRLSYEMHTGTIPDGYVVMHSCDNPACVNPDHLSIGSPKDNTLDALVKQRLKTIYGKGVANRGARLTDDDVRYIKNNPHLRGCDLADKFKVSRATITDIRKGRCWSHIE